MCKNNKTRKKTKNIKTGEKNPLNGRKGHQTLGIGVVAQHPAHGPLSLLLHRRDRLDAGEQPLLLERLGDVGVDEQRVHLRVDVFHRQLEPVEAAGFGDLDFSHKPGGQVF